MRAGCPGCWLLFLYGWAIAATCRATRDDGVREAQRDVGLAAARLVAMDVGRGGATAADRMMRVLPYIRIFKDFCDRKERLLRGTA